MLIDYLRRKPKPFWVIDTHAGAGTYSLVDTFASNNKEYESGVARLWMAKNISAQPIHRYVSAVRNCNSTDELLHYPGSPMLAIAALRKQDRLRLFEAHGNENRVLRANMHQHSGRTRIYDGDGFNGLKTLLPPPARRALTLFDPSYELKQDYLTVQTCLKSTQKRFPTGIYMLWYPQLDNPASQQLTDALRALPVNGLSVTLNVRTSISNGMYGSSLFIVNPPWTLHDDLVGLMPELLQHLAQDNRASFSIKQQAR